MTNSPSPYSPQRPPKTITKVDNYKILEFTSLHTWLLFLTITLCLYVFNEMGKHQGYYQVPYAGLIVLIIYSWIKRFSTVEKVDSAKLRVYFFTRDIRGRHIVDKFKTSVTFLEKLVPIVNIHDQGIIEFSGKIYGVLMETHPMRILEGERDNHEKKIEKVINGIPANTHFKTLSISRLEPRKPISNYLLELANSKGGFKPTDLHLASLYSKVALDNTSVISWKYYAFVSLGERKTLTDAKIQYGAIIPGLLKNMRAARLNPSIYTDETEITNAYRTMFSELVI